MHNTIFNYEDKKFYNDYCSCLEDFSLLEYFEEKDNEYVGKIAPNDTMIPIEIEVHIPLTFPHRKLLFVTHSISGYPHLIPFRDKSGSWFCLNTAFAETAKAQLDEEFERLRDWIRKNMQEGLPRHITNVKVRRGLQMINAYKGQNRDEVRELANKSDLTFVGDFAINRSNFKEDFGYLNIVRYDNNEFYAFENETGTNAKLPYVLVQYIPENDEYFSSWANEFKWGKDISNKLLPDFNYGKTDGTELKRKRKEGERLRDCFFISDETVYNDSKELSEILCTMSLPINHKEAIKKEIDELVESNKRLRDFMNHPIDIDFDIEEPDYEEMHYNYLYNLRYFVIGVVTDGSIIWYLVSTNREKRVKETFDYDFFTYHCTVTEINDVRLLLQNSNTISIDEYFGRGGLHPSFTSKNIAIIGLGALGSTIAEVLARGGAKNLTLWDGDIVEPGNICRSTYVNSDLGNAKAQALAKHIKLISPFCNVKAKGVWYYPDYSGKSKYIDGEFYGNVNYLSQSHFLEELESYDIVIDCTASNELLHFLSYAAKNVTLLSVCITNHATNLLCFSNYNGNPFELRKHYLASIEQDTDNFYQEGTGCFSPTFFASACDIQALANLCVRSINRQMHNNGHVESTIWQYDGDSIIANSLCTFHISGSPITLTVSKGELYKMRQLPMLRTGEMGYLLGGYSTDRKNIYVTGSLSMASSEEYKKMRQTSNGIIDYVGSICVESSIDGTPLNSIIQKIEAMVENDECDTQNPIVASIDKNGRIDFYLYDRGHLFTFSKINKDR